MKEPTTVCPSNCCRCVAFVGTQVCPSRSLPFSLFSISEPRLGWQKGGPFDFADWDRRAPNLLKVLYLSKPKRRPLMNVPLTGFCKSHVAVAPSDSRGSGSWTQAAVAGLLITPTAAFAEVPFSSYHSFMLPMFQDSPLSALRSWRCTPFLPFVQETFQSFGLGILPWAQRQKALGPKR